HVHMRGLRVPLQREVDDHRLGDGDALALERVARLEVVEPEIVAGKSARLGVHRTCAAMAAPKSLVEACPPMSGVRGPPPPTTSSIARTIASAAFFSPKWSSIMAPDQIWPMGLAIFL